MKFDDLSADEQVALLNQQAKELVQVAEGSRVRCIELEKQVEELQAKDHANDAAIALYNVVHDVVRSAMQRGTPKKNGRLDSTYIPMKGAEA